MLWLPWNPRSGHASATRISPRPSVLPELPGPYAVTVLRHRAHLFHTILVRPRKRSGDTTFRLQICNARVIAMFQVSLARSVGCRSSRPARGMGKAHLYLFLFVFNAACLHLSTHSRLSQSGNAGAALFARMVRAGRRGDQQLRRRRGGGGLCRRPSPTLGGARAVGCAGAQSSPPSPRGAPLRAMAQVDAKFVDRHSVRTESYVPGEIPGQARARGPSPGAR